jgi:hypothetical protein
MFKHSKAYYLLILLQVLSVINGVIHLVNKNWLGTTTAIGLFIIFMPNKANLQFYSRGKGEVLKEDNGVHSSLRYFGLFILFVSILLDLLT